MNGYKGDDMGYKNCLKVVAESDRDEMYRGDIIIKDMGRTMNAILDYRFAYKYYEGNRDSVMADKIDTVKNNLAILLGDIAVYMEQLNITDQVDETSRKRIKKLANKLTTIGD